MTGFRRRLLGALALVVISVTGAAFAGAGPFAPRWGDVEIDAIREARDASLVSTPNQIVWPDEATSWYEPADLEVPLGDCEVELSVQVEILWL